MDKLFDLGQNENNYENNYDIREVMTHVGEVIKVIGVGGGGCNAIDNMVKYGVKNVEFICANTDAKALSRNKAHHLLQLGHGLTRGERLANVHGAFHVNASCADRLRGQHVVLVDDVLTTGATLNACANALFAAGTRTMSYLTFGRARTSADR